MTLYAALILSAAAAAAGESGSGRQGAQIVSAQVHAEILRPAIVRQASGLEQQRDAPAPQISRRGRTILVEFQ